MSVISIGTDIVEVDRLQRVCRRHGERFIGRVFTPREVSYCQRRKAADEHYAGRFAAKEAVLKALDSGADLGATWQEIEITNQPSGRPQITLSGQALARAHGMGVTGWLLSISHSHRTAIATAVAVGEPLPPDPSP